MPRKLGEAAMCACSTASTPLPSRRSAVPKMPVHKREAP